MMRITDLITGALSARSISLQDMFNSGGDLSMVGGIGSHAGVRVGVKQAGQLSAVYGSWRIISEAISTLPRNLYSEGTAAVPTLVTPRPVWLDRPSQHELWSEFLGQVLMSLLQDGNAFVLLDWSNFNDGLAAMSVLAPDSCVRESKEIVKITNRATGTVTLVPEFLAESGASLEVMHLRGMTAPGSLHGMSPIAACAETLGVSLAAQRYGASFFKNDATPGGVIEIPPEVKLSDTGRAATREAWSDLFSGPDRAKRVAVLTEGAKFRTLQVAPGEAQFLEQRRFTVQEVARIYGVPPHLLQDNAGTSGWGTAMAEQNNQFVVHSLRPYLERIEARFTELARRIAGDPSVSVVINEEALLRGATAERWSVLRSNVAAGVITADEARLAENMGPLPDGAGAVPWIPLAQAPKEETPDNIEQPAQQEKE